MTDETPVNGASYIVKTLRQDLGEIRKDMQENHSETIRTATLLDAHIRECDRRYAETEVTSRNRYSEAHDAAHRNDTALDRRQVETRMMTKEWFGKQIAEKLMTWVFFTVLAAVAFAVEHGFRPGEHAVQLPSPPSGPKVIP